VLFHPPTASQLLPAAPVLLSQPVALLPHLDPQAWDDDTRATAALLHLDPQFLVLVVPSQLDLSAERRVARVVRALAALPRLVQVAAQDLVLAVPLQLVPVAVQDLAPVFPHSQAVPLDPTLEPTASRSTRTDAREALLHPAVLLHLVAPHLVALSQLAPLVASNRAPLPHLVELLHLVLSHLAVLSQLVPLAASRVALPHLAELLHLVLPHLAALSQLVPSAVDN
jgi:hypothetical protein